MSIEPPQSLDKLISGQLYSIGIHPWSTSAPVSPEAWESLEKALHDDCVVAVGECGLDKNRGGTQQEQEEVFLRQVKLSEKHCKPLIIHCVGRYGRLMELHRQLQPAQQWIIHGFTGKPELCRQLLAEGIDISLGPRSNTALADIVPPERLYRESDE